MQDEPKAHHERQQPSKGHDEALYVSLRQAEKKQNSRYYKASEYFSEWHSIIAALTLLFVAGYTVLTFFLLSNSQSQLAVSRDTETRQLRAYIFLDKADFVINNRTLIATLYLKNSGQTPAYDVQTWQRMRTTAANDPFEPLPKDKTPELGKSTIGPGTTIVPGSVLDVPPDNQTFLAALNSGDAVAYVYGELRYFDAFRHFWCLEFRLRSHHFKDGSWAMQSTTEGNEERHDCLDWPK